MQTRLTLLITCWILIGMVSAAGEQSPNSVAEIESVLNAQQELVNARVALVSAQRDRVVASFTLLASVGRLSPQVLSLRAPVYDSNVHYQQVRDTWAGVRTPDGR